MRMYPRIQNTVWFGWSTPSTFRTNFMSTPMLPSMFASVFVIKSKMMPTVKRNLAERWITVSWAENFDLFGACKWTRRNSYFIYFGGFFFCELLSDATRQSTDNQNDFKSCSKNVIKNSETESINPMRLCPRYYVYFTSFDTNYKWKTHFQFDGHQLLSIIISMKYFRVAQ